MNTSRLRLSLRTALLLLGGLALFSSRLRAQAPAFETSSTLDVWNLPPSRDGFDSPLPPPIRRLPCLRWFRIAPGFLSDPLGMPEKECDLLGVPKMPRSNLRSMTAKTNDGLGWLPFGMGMNNPYFDLRWLGDPGCVGYYRVNTRFASLDSPTTACSLGVQTGTPGGIPFAGVPNGASAFTPSLGVFRTLSNRLGLQSFMAKDFLLTNVNGASMLQRNLQCGLALQRPLSALGPDGLHHLFFCVGALGNLSHNRDGYRLLPSYDLLPGLQWHVNDNWWLSSAVLMPFGPVRSTPGQWQLTCSLRF